ncbi:MAG: IS630 family transposase [Deltaproteobacteria bacterium]|nr:IS630 family transposase [Deltaproteobacteria bacterium]
MARGMTINITLTSEEEQTLTMWAKAGTTEQRMAKRAKVILLSAQGWRLTEVAQGSGLSRQNCSKWRVRFLSQRIEGLADRSRSGRPLSISPEVRLKVTALACTTPPDGSNAWTLRRLARALNVSKDTVHRILNEGELKPHKVEYWCGKSPDPEFEEKQATILGLYLDPPDNALVLAVDEKTGIQALDRTQPMLPMQPGRPKRQTATYKRHGTTCLLAALSVHEGQVEGRCVDRHTHQEFLAFLKHLYRKFPRKHLHIIVDNFTAHKHEKVQEWAAKRRRLTLHFTPTYASWLNQVEIWFNIFSRDVIRGGIWHSKQDLINQIMLYIRQYNQERAHPFKWTYTGKPLAA